MWKDAITAAKQNDQLIVVDFYATWCPPCRRANPILGKMSIDYSDVLFLKVDVDSNRELASEYNVSAMPTFKLLIDEKSEVAEVVGFDEGKLRRNIEEYKAKGGK
jgi:thioredoxin 1